VVKIRWEAPPKRAVPTGKYGAIAKALKANPGEWAVVSDNAPASYVVSIKRGMLAWLHSCWVVRSDFAQELQPQ
jgi:hypothetical protein